MSDIKRKEVRVRVHVYFYIICKTALGNLATLHMFYLVALPEKGRARALHVMCESIGGCGTRVRYL